MSPHSDAYVDALILASRRLGRDAQAQVAQGFFRQISSLHLDTNQSLEIWEKVLERMDEAAQAGQSAPALRQAVLDCLLGSTVLDQPVVTEYSEIERLRAGAVLDPLTGLNNRRTFDDQLERQMEMARRYGEEFSLVILDLNRFKEVNDTRGHATGDQVLVQAAMILRGAVRASDWAYRIGGDEFAALLPRTSSDGALALAERIRQRFAEAVAPLELGVPVGIAYGVATAPREAKETATLFALADERLYQLKRSIGSPRCAPRAFTRIALAHTGAFSEILFDTASHRAQVVDFSFGGVGLKLNAPVGVPREFTTELHLPRLQPVRARVHKVFEIIDPNNIQRLGCAFIEASGP